MRRFTFIVFTFLCSLLVNAQSTQSSKEELWDNFKDPSRSIQERIEAGHVLGMLYKNINSDTSLAVFNETIVLTEEGFEREKAEVLISMASVYRALGNYPMALEKAQESLSIAEELKEDEFVANAYTSMGQTMERQEDFQKALEYHEKALDINKTLKDPSRLGYNYSNLGNIYGQMYMLQTALDTYEKALDYHQEAGNTEGIAVVNGNMGYVHSLQGDSVIYKGGSISEARIYYLQSVSRSKRAMEFFESIGNRHFVLNSKGNIGLVYNSMSDFESARRICTEAFHESRSNKMTPMERDACYCLYTSHKGLGNQDSSLYYFERFVHLKDSLLDMDEQRAFLEKELSYNYLKQAEMAEELHAQELANQKSQSEKDKLIRNITIASISIGLIGVLFFTLFVYSRLKVIRKQHKLIERQKEDLQAQKELVDHKNAEILDSIVYARRLQTAILPSKTKLAKSLPEYFIFYRPKDIVAGDFYWMFEAEDSLIFAVADCTGHGVPGAMVSVVCNNALNRAVREYGLRVPGEILDKTREIILGEFTENELEVKDGMDIALVNIQHRNDGAKVLFAGAHNPLWMLKKGDLMVSEIKADKQPIGKFDHSKAFTTHEVYLHPGDTIYLFSDGYVDQFGGEKGKKFKATNLKKLLLDTHSEPLQSQHQKIESTIDQWMGEMEQVDDICVVGIRF